MWFEALTWIFIIIATYYVWRTYYKNRKIIEFSRHQTGPKAYPVIGHFHLLFKKNIIDSLLDLKRQCGMPTNIWIGNQYYYITDDPKEIKTFLTSSHKCFNKALFYDDLIRVIIGDTFIMASVEKINKWKMERSISAKALNPSMWSFYTPVFHMKANKLLKNMENISTFYTFYKTLISISFEIFLENFMGIKNKSDKEQCKLELDLNEILEMLAYRSILSRLIPHWIWKYFTKEGRRFSCLVNQIQAKIKELIEEKRSEYLQKIEFIENTNRLKLIDALLLKGDSDYDIFQQMLSIYFTSIETSALVVSYTLFSLGMHPEIQKKVYEEVVNNVGHREITSKDLITLKYLEQTIYETLRVLPIIPIAGRHLTGDINLGNKTIPKGANVAIIPYLLHRNEKVWSNPEKFDPNRFSSENIQNITPGSYIPFLMGPRDCIGRYYIMAQAKIFLANILRNYRVHVDQEVMKTFKFKFYIVIKPKKDFSMHFEKIENK